MQLARMSHAMNPARFPPSNLSFVLPLDYASAGAVNLAPLLALGSATPTFTRATTATTVGPTGLILPISSGIARAYFDPTTLQYRGYLPEGARTNLAIQSGDISNASWTKTRATTPGTTTTAPDGTVSAQKLIEDATAASTHQVAVSNWTSTLAAYTWSFWAKAGERTKVQLGISSLHIPGTGANALFTLSGAGTATNQNNFDSVSIVAYPNGWYRCIGTFTPTAAAAGASFLYLCDASGTNVYSGDGSSGLYIWGAQIELGAFASSYIPTTTVAVARNADALTYASAGNADATQGTCYAELGTEWSVATGGEQLGIGFGVTSGPLETASGNNPTVIRSIDGTSAIQKAGLSSMFSAPQKVASSWAGSSRSITGNGLGVTTGAFDGDMGSTAIGIGCRPDGAVQWFGTIRNVRIWNTQLSDADLQALTA